MHAHLSCISRTKCVLKGVCRVIILFLVYANICLSTNDVAMNSEFFNYHVGIKKWFTRSIDGSNFILCKENIVLPSLIFRMHY